MDKQTLKAKTRKILGRKVKQLRKQGILPANIYGKNIDSLAAEVDLKEFEKVYKKVGETGLVELLVGGKRKPVLIHNIQKDPVNDTFVHVDFLQVDLKKKVVAQVHIELSGEAPAEKQGLGTVVQYIDEIEVEALPTDLPEKFELDLSKLEKVDDAVYVKDIKVDTKTVEIKNDPEQILVKVEELRKEEEPVVAEEEVEEAEDGEEKEAPSESEKGQPKEDGEENEKKKDKD